MTILAVSSAREAAGGDAFEVVVQDAVDDAQRLRALLGRHPPDHEIDSIRKPESIGTR